VRNAGAMAIFQRVIGFIVIIITLSLGSTIYTANASIVSANLTNLIGMSAISGFGAFIIIFGLLISGGLLTISGRGGGSKALSMMDMLSVVLSVVAIVIALSLFGNVITYTNTLITSAITASDSLGQVGFGIIPILIYVGIIAGAGWTQYRAIRKQSRAKKTARTAYI
jgi:hypothetical protein